MSVNFTDNSPEILAELERKKAMALRAMGGAGEGFVKEEITEMGAVDTGRMRNDVTHQEDSDSTTIGLATSYAIFVHEGSRGRGGRPFLRNGILDNKKQFEQLAKTILEG